MLSSLKNLQINRVPPPDHIEVPNSVENLDYRIARDILYAQITTIT